MDIYYLDVLDLYLDTENPRHDPLQDQPKIIQQLISNEKVKKLAQDIAENGISPLDIFAVMEDENENYIVLEGNRRICALTLLNDPDAAPPGDKTYFEKLSEKSDVPSEVPCVIFEDRDDARLWLERRHVGPLEGVGIVSWNAIQKTRFFKGSNNTLAVKLLDYAVENDLMSEEDRQKGILTTATRFLSTPKVRHTLGISSGVSDSDIKIEVDKDQFDRVLGRFCDDLVNGSNGVTSRTNSKDREKYVRKLKTSGIAPTTHTEPYLLGSKPDTDGGSSRIGEKGKRNNRNADLRDTIIPNSCKVTITDKNLKRVYDELRGLELKKYPFAASILCRAFLEDVYHFFYESTQGKSFKGKVHVLLQENITFIEGSGDQLTRKQQKALTALKQVQSSKANALSPHNLGAIAHATYSPDPLQLKRAWDNIEEIMKYMIGKI